MSEPVRDDRSAAAEYTLGLLRGDERRAFEDQRAAEPGLDAAIEGWQTRLADLDGTDGEPVPAGSFEKILARIDDEGLFLPGTATRRAANAQWLEYSEGIVYRVLNVDARLRRQTLLVKMQPGAIYYSHTHDIDEECLVIEGDLQFGDLVLGAGDFHLATPAMTHPVGRTSTGCLLHVVVGMNI
jgi:hypothetical protein